MFILIPVTLIAAYILFVPSRTETMPLEHQHAFENGRQFDAEFKYR